MTKDKLLHILATPVLFGIPAYFLLTSCATMASLDYVQSPPREYVRPVTVMVEFVQPEAVALRCIQRGVPMLTNGCADDKLITIGLPVGEIDGPYARRLAHELGHVNGWDSAHNEPIPRLPDLAGR